MGDLVLHHFQTNWFGARADMATYFVLSSAYSRYGCWGATEDYRIPLTPKFNAIYALTGYTFVAAPPAPAPLTATPAAGVVTLGWGASAGASLYSVQRGTAPGGPYTVVATPATPGYTDARAAFGVTYYYIVTASINGIESLASNEVSAQAIVPETPVVPRQPKEHPPARK